MKFEHENPLFSEPKFEVAVDAWENQRYRPLQGGWQGPWNSEQMPFFSDIKGDTPIPFDRSTLVPSVNLPLGWKWCTDNWSVDMSQSFGSTDNEGWSYASSFETLVENSIKKKLEGEMGRLSMVRRRRWSRARTCITNDAKREFEYRLTWLKDFRGRLELVISDKNALSSRLTEYELKRKQLFVVVFESAEDSLLDTSKLLDGIAEKLQLIRQFLIERGALERDYSKKLAQLGGKWIHAGGSVGNTGDETAAEGADSESPKRNPGFFYLVSSASQKIAKLFDEFSSMLTVSLPADVEAIVNEVLLIRSEYQREAPKLKSVLKAREDALSKQIATYKTTLELSQDRDAARSAELLSSFFEVSAALNVTEDATTHHHQHHSSAGESGPAGVSGGNAGAAATTTPNATASLSAAYKGIDVWLAVQRYKRAVVDTDSSLFVYNGFAIQQRRNTHQTSTRVAALLHSLLSVFSTEQSRTWSDAAVIMRSFRPVGQNNAAEVPTVRITGGGETTREQTNVASANNNNPAMEVPTAVSMLEINLSDDSTSPSSPRRSPHSPSGRGETGGLSPARIPLHQRSFEDGQEVDEAEIEREILGIQSAFPEPPPMPDGAPIALFGRLQFAQWSAKSSTGTSGSSSSSAMRKMSLTGSKPAASGNSSNNSTTASSSSATSCSTVGTESILHIAPSRNDVVWKEVGAVITFDHMLHIFTTVDFPTGNKMDTWIGEDPILSVDLSTVEVEPSLMPIAGARDVFELRPRTSAYSMGIFTAATPNQPTILLQTNSPDENRTWMRIATNPVADPLLDPPEAQLANSQIEKQRELLLSSIVIPAPSVEGIEC